MVYDRAARGEDGGVVHRIHNLDVVEQRTPVHSLRPVQISARSPNCVQTALITLTVSAADVHQPSPVSQALHCSARRAQLFSATT